MEKIENNDVIIEFETEDDNKEDNNPFAINPYDEYGVKPSDFY